MAQNISSDRVMLSTSQAVQQSGMSREHIQRLLRMGILEGAKPGHDWFVYKDSLTAFLAQPRKRGRKGTQNAQQNHEEAIQKNTIDTTK